jgi:hypothetical protein
MSTFNIVFTSLPPLVIGIFEKDIMEYIIVRVSNASPFTGLRFSGSFTDFCELEFHVRSTSILNFTSGLKKECIIVQQRYVPGCWLVWHTRQVSSATQRKNFK